MSNPAGNTKNLSERTVLIVTT